MKKTSLIAIIYGMLLCSFCLPIAAQDSCDSSWSCCDESILDGKFRIGAEWLYWRTKEDGLLSAVFTDTADPLNSRSQAIHPCAKYDNGFKVWADYELPDCCWDVSVSYLYVPGFARRSASTSESPDTQTIFVALDDLLTEGFPSVTDINMKWNSNFQLIDVDFGKTLCFGECFNLRPHMGFRTIWMNQNFHYHATNAVDILAATSHTAYKQRFKSWGVEGGLCAEWKIGYGLSIIGNFGGSILYSKTHVSERIELLSAAGDVLPGSIGCDSICSVTPTMDYFAGLQYTSCMCEMNFNIHVGWEQHILFAANRTRFFGGDRNIALQGLTLGMEVSF